MKTGQQAWLRRLTAGSGQTGKTTLLFLSGNGEKKKKIGLDENAKTGKRSSDSFTKGIVADGGEKSDAKIS